MCSLTMVLKARSEFKLQKSFEPKYRIVSSNAMTELNKEIVTYLPTPVNSLRVLSSFQFPTRIPCPLAVNLLNPASVWLDIFELI